MAIINPIEGAVGGWWFHSHRDHANFANFDYNWTFRVSLLSGGGFISRWKSAYGGGTSGPPPGDPTGPLTVLESRYNIYHRWSENPLLGNQFTDLQETVVVGSPADDDSASYGSRSQIWRWAMTFRCSTWTGSSYLADGFSRLYLNDVLVSEGINLTIPRRFTAENQSLYYQAHVFGYTDRIWARKLPIVLPTDSQGAMIGPPPTDLLFFDDFENGDFSNWGIFSSIYDDGIPNAMSSAGGNSGWGITSFCRPPTASAPCSPGVTYKGSATLNRSFVYASDVTSEVRISQLPIEIAVGTIIIVEPPELPGTSGIYFINPAKSSRHDSYYGGVEKKIPNPTIKTALIGE